MMQRAFDLPWRFSRRLGGNAQHKRATRRFWSFTGYIFRGSTSERDQLHFSGFGRTPYSPLPCSAFVEFLIEGWELIGPLVV